MAALVMRTATDQSVGQSGATVERGSAVANTVISGTAITFSSSVENLLKY